MEALQREEEAGRGGKDLDTKELTLLTDVLNSHLLFGLLPISEEEPNPFRNRVSHTLTSSTHHGLPLMHTNMFPVWRARRHNSSRLASCTAFDL